jgi:hypothetical protein
VDGRVILPSVNESGSLASLSDFAERLYWRMLAVSDEWGRLSGAPDKIRFRCISRLERSEADIEAALDELIAAGRIERYCEGGKWTTQLLDFNKQQPYEVWGRQNLRHQRSRFPDKTPASTEASVPRLDARARVGASKQAQSFSSLYAPLGVGGVGGGGESKSREESGEEPAREAKCPPKRPRDELWDVLVEELGEPQTRTERGRRNKALLELREIEATPDELRCRIAGFRLRWPQAAVTATGIAANWTLLGSAPSGRLSDEERGQRFRERMERMGKL